MIKVFTLDINWRHLWLDYRSEFFFGAVLGVLGRRVFSQIFTRETGTTPTEWK